MYLLIIFVLLFLLKTISFYFLNKNKTLKQSLADSFVFVPKIILQQVAFFGVWSFLLRDYFPIGFQYILGIFIFQAIKKR